MAIALQLEAHRAAEQRRRAPDQRIVVGIDRVGVGRHEEPRAVALHLVHRQEDLRMPLRVEEPRQVAVLRQVHHERVAVDVVAGVLVIQPRHRRRLRTASPSALVPVDDQAMAVRIERRDQDDDDVLQDVEGRRIGGGGQLVEQLVGRLRRADFGGVDAAADGEHRLLRRARSAARRPATASADRPAGGWSPESRRGWRCSRAR